MLRERKERLLFLREKRRMPGEGLEWWRPMMDREQRVLEPEAPPQPAKPLRSDGHPEAGHTGSRSWWRRKAEVLGGVGSSATQGSRAGARGKSARITFADSGERPPYNRWCRIRALGTGRIVGTCGGEIT